MYFNFQLKAALCYSPEIIPVESTILLFLHLTDISTLVEGHVVHEAVHDHQNDPGNVVDQEAVIEKAATKLLFNRIHHNNNTH